jgi:hypothetical protein
MERFFCFLALIFSPVSAMHAANYLTQNIYPKCNYLLIAKSLLKTSLFKNLIRKEFYIAEHNQLIIDAQDWKAYWNQRKIFIYELLKNYKITFERIIADPKKMDENAIAFCPICGCEYIILQERCNDCGIKLKKF